LAAALFGTLYRWVGSNFPFTDPSYELKSTTQGEWLRCWDAESFILRFRQCRRGTEQGWAFGLGLERLAMVLFDIPDIRLFWTEDERFMCNFDPGDHQVSTY
jgi:phenylalanyl-tRNA synthetase alpha chain